MAEMRQPPAQPTGEREAWRERLSAWRRYHDRAPRRGEARAPADRIAAATWLYDLLPPASRVRPIDPSGIARLRACLAVLERR